MDSIDRCLTGLADRPGIVAFQLEAFGKPGLRATSMFANESDRQFHGKDDNKDHRLTA